MKTTEAHLLFGLFLLMCLLLAGLWVFFAETAVAGTPWYINASSGQNSDNCLSPDSACVTINVALSKANPGDTNNITAGTYGGTISIDQAVTLIGSGTDQTTIDAIAANFKVPSIDGRCPYFL